MESNLRDKFLQLTFRFTWPAWLQYFCNLSRLILEKAGSTPVLTKHKKGVFPLKRAFLSESQQPVRWVSNQISSLRVETHFFFFTYVQLTVILHYRIGGFLRMELLVQNSFYREVFHLRAAMKTQRFANIWKAALASLAHLLLCPWC